MRSCIIATVVVIVLSGALDARQAPADIHRLAWLQGCWHAVSTTQTTEEQWMAPRGGSMLGMSRTIRGGRLVEYELVVLRDEGERLAYHAHPSGQPSAVFLSRRLEGSSVVFENPEHDFPQEVGYARTAPDALLAWIAGTSRGQPRRVEFRYQRVTCDAGSP